MYWVDVPKRKKRGSIFKEEHLETCLSKKKCNWVSQKNCTLSKSVSIFFLNTSYCITVHISAVG